MGGNRKHGNSYVELEWCATLGGMVHRGTQVRATCRVCKVCLEVDVIALLVRLGPRASLVDYHPRCRVVGCTGHVIFDASPSQGTPFMPCISRPSP